MLEQPVLARMGPRQAAWCKGQAGVRGQGQALGGVGGGSAVFVLEAESSLFFHKLWEKPHPLPPHLCKPSPFPRSLQAGARCPRATAQESISVCKPVLGGGGYPEMPPSAPPGPRGSLGTCLPRLL